MGTGARTSFFETRDELLGAGEVAEYLGVHQGTVYRWCREGRLPCVKLGKYWRLRKRDLESLLAQEEPPATLAGQLSSFFCVPDNLLGIASTQELLHWLDAAFFRVGEERGGLLIKFHGGDPGSEEVRARLERGGLDVEHLERDGRLRLLEDPGRLGGRPEALGRLTTGEARSGRSVWAAFDWEERIGPEAALDQQQALTRLTESRRIVIKTSLLEEATAEWSSATWQRAQALHPGKIWLSEAGLSLSRTTPLPSA